MTVETYEWHEDPEQPGTFVPDDGPVTIYPGDIVTLSGELTYDMDQGLVVPMPWLTSKIIRDPEHICWNCGGSVCRNCDNGLCPTCGVSL